ASAPLTRVSRTGAGIVIETGGTSVTVALRHWPMPIGRGGDHGTRERMVCPRCGAFRDILHWRGEWGCRGKDCLDLAHSGSPRAAVVPRDPPACKALAQARAVFTEGLESKAVAGADCAPGSGDACELEASEPRSDKAETTPCPTWSS